MPGERILVVDDEAQIRKVLRHRLEVAGYAVITAEDGEQALLQFRQNKPDLVILDISMPHLDGYQVCAAIREESNAPVMVLSARTDESDRLAGLRLGADDYITKPFSLAELVLRVAAVLRRSNNAGSADVLRFPGLEIDRQRHIVLRAGEPLELTAREFDLLWLLASHPHIVFTREQILSRLWGDNQYEADLSNVTVCISRLRDKLEPPGSPRMVQTVRGVGYRFAPEGVPVPRPDGADASA